MCRYGENIPTLSYSNSIKNHYNCGPECYQFSDSKPPSSHTCVSTTSCHVLHNAVSVLLIMMFYLLDDPLPVKSTICPHSHLFQFNYYCLQELSFVLLVRINLLFSFVVTIFFIFYIVINLTYVFMLHKGLHKEPYLSVLNKHIC